MISNLKGLISKLMMLPGVGEKTATKYALHIIQNPKLAESLAKEILSLKDKVKLCKECFFLADGEFCHICRDPERTRKIICVVESIEDVINIEKTGYSGLYHVLWGVISASDSPSDIKIKELIERVSKGECEEVILFLDTTIEGETTSMYITSLIKNFVKVSRPAYGIPMGAEIEFMDAITIKKALEGRTEIKMNRK